jgi:hypothetical protein
MTNISHDPAHWRQRADEMRAAAKETIDADAKEALLKFAADYDRLADLALKRAHAKFPESLPY